MSVLPMETSGMGRDGDCSESVVNSASSPAVICEGELCASSSTSSLKPCVQERRPFTKHQLRLYFVRNWDHQRRRP
ncbi:hypothetical protein C8Q74DRAFT_278161 [Fomes fomentarius]|nr:hypothetical protein C8Q74DRAFT_278161 [Fomes fomentarius]